MSILQENWQEAKQYPRTVQGRISLAEGSGQFGSRQCPTEPEQDI